MKRVIKMNLMGLLTLSLFTACEKPNENGEGSGETANTDYEEKAFGMNLEMVYVEGGTFEMGATAEQGDDVTDEEFPVRTIKLDSYYIGKYEVTQAQWKAVMGTDAYYPYEAGKGDTYPVYFVNWNEAQAFCKKLSEQTGKKYMLPTEAQWEYAARGGNRSQHYKYAGSNNIDVVAWCEDNSGYETHSVGSKKANELGIYDMSGNVAEWCSDRFGDYDESDTDNPQGPTNGSERISRGGSWHSEAIYCRVSYRGFDLPSSRDFAPGFRVACIAE